LRILPYTAQHAFRLFDLPNHHADPFDRQIIGQALAEDLAIVTPDNVFRLYSWFQAAPAVLAFTCSTRPIEPQCGVSSARSSSA
jgi:hypothetical protein